MPPVHYPRNVKCLWHHIQLLFFCYEFFSFWEGWWKKYVWMCYIYFIFGGVIEKSKYECVIYIYFIFGGVMEKSIYECVIYIFHFWRGDGKKYIWMCYIYFIIFIWLYVIEVYCLMILTFCWMRNPLWFIYIYIYNGN